MRQVVRYGGLALLLGYLPACADSNQASVAGRYYTTLSADGEPHRCFDDARQGATALGYAQATGVVAGYVVACGDSCYLYPTTAATAQAARPARIGPLDEAGCRQKTRRLTGDSLRLERTEL